MTNRERVMAILHYEKYDRIPLVAFGYWTETLDKWADEGHITHKEAIEYAQQGDNSAADRSIMDKLGFDFNWNRCIGGNNTLFPLFEEKVLEVDDDGSQVVSDGLGHITRMKPGVSSIPAEIGTLLTDRSVWESEYLPRLKDSADRVNLEMMSRIKAQDSERTDPLALHCGSLYGRIRDIMGVVHLSYLMADDEELFAEVIDVCATLCYDVVKRMLATGIKFDYAHFWEDICFKNGPLIKPSLFEEFVAPHYRKIADLVNANGIDIISLDCDGMIDKLVPIWLRHGVNTMFPIEVGTWNASIEPWRKQYGRDLRGVGGMDKRVFACDRAEIDKEIERLKPLIDLGGYIPCPDHRIAPDAKFDLVQYYCERFQKAFG